MSCSDRCGCGSGCKCGSSCKCGSGSKCGSCQMYPDFMEGNTSSETYILGVAPQDVKTDVSGMMMGSENGGCGCKCGSSCTCDPCTCKK